MKHVIRRCAVVILALLVMNTISHAAHMYYLGVVSSIANNQMTVANKTYQIATNIRIILMVKGANGAMHPQKGRLSDIYVGNDITIKVSNGEIVEIEKIVSR